MRRHTKGDEACRDSDRHAENKRCQEKLFEKLRTQIVRIALRVIPRQQLNVEPVVSVRHCCICFKRPTPVG